MGRSPCCEKVGLKKGPWTPEEDQKLLAYIEEHGHGSWRALPAKAGLQRCGKSCRLRWTNYLRPDIKRGKFSLQEEQTIIQLHALLGNRWSAIATHLSKRTDNEIKNYWNTHLKKRLAKMGIDPVTHKPKSDALSSVDGEAKNAANLSHMAQWESARLEAEARLVRESKLRSNTNKFQHHQLGSAQASSSVSSLSAPLLNQPAAPPAPALCLDIIKAWQGGWSTSNSTRGGGSVSGLIAGGHDIESPTSTLSYSENAPAVASNVGFGEGEEDWKVFDKSTHFPVLKERVENPMIFNTGTGLHDMGFPSDGPWTPESLNINNENVGTSNFLDGFTDLLLKNSADRDSSDCGGDSDNEYEENKNYWNSILNLVNSSSPPDAPVF